MIFIEKETNNPVPFVTYDPVADLIRVNANLSQYLVYNNLKITISVSIIPTLTVRANLSGFTMSVMFNEIYNTLCSSTVLIQNEEIPIL